MKTVEGQPPITHHLCSVVNNHCYIRRRTQHKDETYLNYLSANKIKLLLSFDLVNLFPIYVSFAANSTLKADKSIDFSCTAVSEAYFANMIGVPFIAVMPKSTAQSKIKQIEFYGGKCHFVTLPLTCTRRRWRLPEK